LTLEISENFYDELISLVKSETGPQQIINIEQIKRDAAERAAAQAHLWARELFADIFSVYMFGPAALLAHIEFIGPAKKRLDVTNDLYYPTERIRLKVLLAEYSHWMNGQDWTKKIPAGVRNAFEKEIRFFSDLLKTDFDNVILFRDQHGKKAENQEYLNILYNVLYNNVDIFIAKLRPLVERVINHNKSCFLTPSDLENLSSNLMDLENDLPTSFELTDKNENKLLGLLLNAGWLTWLKEKHDKSITNFSGYEQKERLFTKINLLLEKSIENAEISRWFNNRRSYGKEDGQNENPTINGFDALIPLRSNSRGGVLSKNELVKRCQNDLLFIPLLDRKSQIGSCSIDVRLGNEFILTQTPKVASLDPIELEASVNVAEFQNRINIPLGYPLILHPGQFVLGSTLEYLSIPDDLMGLLVGRSSWGRLGFVISTPNKVQPGFKGCLTLQLSNLGNTPISLYPCSRVGQIVFFSLKK
jgi:dCTP deaminase